MLGREPRPLVFGSVRRYALSTHAHSGGRWAMDPWFVDESEYIRLWAWLARAPAEGADARCPPVESRPRPDAFRPPGVYGEPAGGSAAVARLSAPLRAVEYRVTP